MRTMLCNNLTLKSGFALERRRVLELVNQFAGEHPKLLQVPGRVKIAIAESGSA
jgi:hypothetical protein